MNISHKNEILTFATTWIDLEGIMPLDVTQAEKDKFCVILHIYNEYKDKTSKLTKQNENRQQTHRYKGQTSGCQK